MTKHRQVYTYMNTHSKNEIYRTQIVSCTPGIHPYLLIMRETHYSATSKKGEVSSLQIPTYTHAQTLSTLSLSSDTNIHTRTNSLLSHSLSLSLSLSLSRPLPHWTGQLDGLLGMMKWLCKAVGFEVCFEGSKRRQLTDCRGKWAPNDKGLIAERAMSKRLHFFSGELSVTFLSERECW